VLTSHTFNPKIYIKAVLNPEVYFRNIKKMVEEIKKKKSNAIFASTLSQSCSELLLSVLQAEQLAQVKAQRHTFTF